MAEELKPVNLPAAMPQYSSEPSAPGPSQPTQDYHKIFQSLVSEATPKTGDALPVIATSGIDTSGRYPKYFTGIDNESLYADNQGFFEKGFNGVAKMTGIAGSTFLNGTVGLVNGMYEWYQTGKFSSIYDNSVSRELNEFTESLTDSLAFYKTERQRNASWWEPENLFSGNMLFDNIVSNFGFMLGAGAAGIATGGLFSKVLKGLSSAAGLISTGVKGAATADAIIGEAMSTLSPVNSLSNATNRLNSAWNAAKSSIGQGIASSDRVVKAIAATAGEAGIEALNSANQYRERMINEYTQSYGVAPTGKDLEEIDAYASRVGNVAFGLNTALLSASNYVMLPKVFSSSFKSERTLLNNIAREAGEGYVSTLPKTGLGKYAYGAYKGVGTIFSAVEGLEEAGQYAIETGTQNYFARKNRNKDADIVKDMLGFGIKEALTSDEGLLNLFVGGVSGGIMTMGVFGKGADGKFGIGKGGTIEQRGFFGFGGEEEKIRQSAISNFNKTLASKILNINRTIAASEDIQEERKKAVEDGDLFVAKNLETDYTHAFIETRMQYGAEELIYDEINELRERANTDFTSLQKEGIPAQLDTKETFLKRLDEVEAQAKLTVKLQKELETTYGTIIGDNGKPVYPPSVISNLTYQMVKVNDFTKRINEMSSDLVKDNILIDRFLEKLSSGESLTTEDYAELDKMVRDIPNQPDSYKGEVGKKVIDTINSARHRKAHIDAYNKVFEKPENYATEDVIDKGIPEEPKEAEEKGPSILIDTERGERQYGIGKKYFVNKLGFDDKGRKVFEFPSFTLLGKNEDGTIKIELPDGKIVDVPADKFKNYKIGSLTAIEKNKKALFYLEHANDIFEFNFGKDKKTGASRKRKGRIEYDPEKDAIKFVYKDPRTGKIDSIVVTGQHFVAKKGFVNPMIKKVGQLTAVQQKAMKDLIEDKSPSPEFLEKVKTIPGVLEILFEETLETLEDTKQLIENKREELSKIENELSKLKGKVEGPNAITQKTKRFKAVTHRNLQAIASLTKLRDRLTREVQSLEREQEELEFRLDDLIETAELVRIQPGTYQDMYDSLLLQRKGLENAITETGLQINKLSDLLNDVEKVLKRAWNSANKLVNKFFDKYPNMPLDRIGIIDFLNRNLEDTEKEKAITPTSEAEKILPYTAVAGNLFEDLHKLDADIAAIDEIDVVPNEAIVNELQDNINGLNEKLAEYEKQVSSRTGTLKRLKELEAVHKIEVEKAEALERQAGLKINEVKEQFLGTADNSTPTVNFDAGFEEDDKKSRLNVIRSSISISRKLLRSKGEEIRPHHDRADQFGFKYESLPNKAKIGGVLISKANEDQVQMGGLIDHMKGHDKTVVLVMVQINDDGSIVPVDVNGVPVEGNAVEKGVYQTMPDPKLTWSTGESMFREEDKEVEDEFRKIYQKTIDDIIGNPSLDTYKIVPSFGQPLYSVLPDEKDSKGNPKRNYNATNNVFESGLIPETDIESRPVVYIPTTNDRIELGSTSYSKALGRIFLDTGNAYVKLKNKKQGNEGAERIYEAVLRLATIGVVKGNTEANDIISWLRTVIYWGTPRGELSYNSLFFEDSDDGLLLSVSGKGMKIPFNPTDLKANKDILIGMLSEMYHNVNSRLTSSASEYNKPYTELLSISEDGKQKVRQWPNYQSYLLSPTYPDGTVRPNESIPLTTDIRPLETPASINREDIYFILENMPIDKYLKVTPPKKREVGSRAAQTVAEVKPDTNFILDGKTPNELSVLNNTAKISFVADKDNFYDDNGVPQIVSVAIIEGEDAISEKFKGDMKLASEKLTKLVVVKLTPVIDEYLDNKNRAEATVVVQQQPSQEVNIDGVTIVPLLGGKVSVEFELDPANLYNENSILNLKRLEVVQGMQALRDSYPGKSDNELLQNVGKYIITKYQPSVDAQLLGKEAAPSATPAAPQTSTVPGTVSVDALNKVLGKVGDSKKPNREYRLSVTNATESKLEIENWEEFEKWLGKSFPNIRVYRTKQMIQAANGRQAWGMFQDGAIYVYENALVGTAYHEVYEAIWDALVSPEEKAAIYSELRQREGSFFDAGSMSEVNYADATEAQLKEKIADEFAEYVAKNKPAKSLLERIFDEIIEFFKTFFFGEEGASNTEKLFAKINNGYYAKYNPFESKLTFAKAGVIDINKAIANGNAEYRYASLGFTDVQWNDLMQQMTYYMTSELLYDPENPEKSIFDVVKEKKKGSDIYNRLFANLLYDIQEQVQVIVDEMDAKKRSKTDGDAEILRYASLWENIEKAWPNIVESHRIFLAPYEIEFDEEDSIIVRDENNSGKEDYKNATQIDFFKKAPSAMKLFLATLPVVDESGTVVRSTVNGVRLQPLSKVKVDLLNNLSDSVTPDDMIGKLRKLSQKDIAYKILYDRVTSGIPNFSLDKFNHKSQTSIMNGLWSMFKMNRPDVRFVNVLLNGEVVVTDSNFSSASGQIYIDFESAITAKIRDPKNNVYEYRDVAGDRGYYIKEAAVPASIKNVEQAVSFLSSLGIDLNRAKIEASPKKQKFLEIVGGIASSVRGAKRIASINAKTLNIKKRLRQLAEIQATIDSPEFDTVFYNLNGEKQQSFIPPNVHSELFDALSKISNLSELQGTTFQYLMNDGDPFSQNSTIINMMFDRKTGNKRVYEEGILKYGYTEGLNNTLNNRKYPSARMNERTRLIVQLNMMLDGYHFNLVPGDGGLESMTYLGNTIEISDTGEVDSISKQLGTIQKIFKGYFIDEVNVSRQNRQIVSAKGRASTDLRFFKTMLDAKTHDAIVRDTSLSPKDLYDKYKDKIEEAVKDYLELQQMELVEDLSRYNIMVSSDADGFYSLVNIAAIADRSKDEIDAIAHAVVSNFTVANIEFHKLIYSDPYFYKDELKRVKNFNSPSRALAAGSAKFNVALNKAWNKNYLSKEDIGYTDFTTDELRTATIADIIAYDPNNPDYEPWEEGDGGGIVTIKGVRRMRIESGEWSDDDELQYEYEIAYEKYARGFFDQLTPREEELIEKYGDTDGPKIQSTFTPRKPKVSGNKNNGKPYNDVMLDKFALYPISYRMAERLSIDGTGGNLKKLYEAMQNNNIDYVVFSSGRKVGKGRVHEVYRDGEFILNNFGTVEDEGITNVPLSIFTNQTDVPTKEESTVNTGTQSVKLMTMDLLDGGVPVDFLEGKEYETAYAEWFSLSKDEKLKRSKVWAEIVRNQELVQAMILNGVEELMDELGIQKVNGNYEIVDRSKTYDTLRSQMFRMEVNDNIIASLSDFLNQTTILESTPAYKSIRNILYSIADARVISRKMTGGQKVQIPSSFLESAKVKPVTINNKEAYASNTLKFYTDKDENGNEIRVAEVMVRRWFKSDMTDQQLLDYLNNTEKGQEVLKGIAYRIPTQKQNSIDVFKIAKFLPEEFGDAVVIPSSLVRKVGSDFDIDKLTMYFKNVVKDKDGNPTLLPEFGIGKEGLENATKYYEEVNGDELDLYSSLFDAVLRPEYEDQINDLLDKKNKKEKAIRTLYRKSLQNAYIESSEKLMTNDYNFKQMIKPNSADLLKKNVADLLKDMGVTRPDYNNVSTLINFREMRNIRYNLVSGKYAIGIAAQAQTFHSLFQRARVYIDMSRAELDIEDKLWLDDGKINFRNYNTITIDGKKYPTLSKIKDASNKNFISDINSMFMDGYVDISKDEFIMLMGATPELAGVYLFLVNIGVDVREIMYFMNQPIIREYILQVTSRGYKSLFIKDFVDSTMDMYSTTSAVVVDTIPNLESLSKMVGKKSSDLTDGEKAAQSFMLLEFLKYAKMAEQLFYVQQGTNFDTTNFNDPFLVFKKYIMLKRARNTIFAGVDEMLENSFLGVLGESYEDVRNIIAEVIPSDKGQVRSLIEEILLPYVYLPEKSFIRIAQAAVADLFDWAVQNDLGLNRRLEDILVSKKGTAKQVTEFFKTIKPGHPLYKNYVVESLAPMFGNREDTANNLYIKNKSNKVYDQNRLIYGFEQLKEYLNSVNRGSLYDDILDLSILQSGLKVTPVSFTSLIPYDDFKNKYADTLSYLNEFPNLDIFKNLNMFQRNNWNNTDIVDSNSARYIAGMYNPNMGKFLPKVVQEAVFNGQIPKIVQLPASKGTDIITYIWEEGTSAEKRAMRKNQDYSFRHKGLFQKVYRDSAKTDPLIQEYTSKKTGKTYLSYVYKMINPLGQGAFANEFYLEARPSVFDNGYEKVYKHSEIKHYYTPQGQKLDKTYERLYSDEVEDSKIVDIYDGVKPTVTASQPAQSSTTTINIYAGTGENADLSNFAIRPFNYKGQEFKSVEQAFQYIKVSDYAAVTTENNNVLEEILETTNGSNLRYLGSNKATTRLDTKTWDANSPRVMKELLKASFEQNPDALARLLATGNATLTHTQDKGKWGTEFPRLLMEVRNELRSEDKDWTNTNNTSENPFQC